MKKLVISISIAMFYFLICNFSMADEEYTSIHTNSGDYSIAKSYSSKETIIFKDSRTNTTWDLSPYTYGLWIDYVAFSINSGSIYIVQGDVIHYFNPENLLFSTLDPHDGTEMTLVTYDITRAPDFTNLHNTRTIRHGEKLAENSFGRLGNSYLKIARDQQNEEIADQSFESILSNFEMYRNTDKNIRFSFHIYKTKE